VQGATGEQQECCQQRCRSPGQCLCRGERAWSVPTPCTRNPREGPQQQAPWSRTTIHNLCHPQLSRTKSTSPPRGRGGKHTMAGPRLAALSGKMAEPTATEVAAEPAPVPPPVPAPAPDAMEDDDDDVPLSSLQAAAAPGVWRKTCTLPVPATAPVFVLTSTFGLLLGLGGGWDASFPDAAPQAAAAPPPPAAPAPAPADDDDDDDVPLSSLGGVATAGGLDGHCWGGPMFLTLAWRATPRPQGISHPACRPWACVSSSLCPATPLPSCYCQEGGRW
jgi:hypothetical protein